MNDRPLTFLVSRSLLAYGFCLQSTFPPISNNIPPDKNQPTQSKHPKAKAIQRRGKFPQISINATVTKIQRPIKHEIARRTAKKDPAQRLTCSSHALSQFLVTVPVYWPWHASEKIKRGGHFGVLFAYNCAQKNRLYKATDQNKECGFSSTYSRAQKDKRYDLESHGQNKAWVQSQRNKSNVQEFKVFQIKTYLGRI